MKKSGFSIDDFLQKKTRYLKLANEHLTPFYIFEEEELKTSIQEFLDAFNKEIPRLKTFYAVKSNHHPYVLETVVKQGLGLDVSSGDELELALNFGTKEIVFNSPGKTKEELELAIRNAERVIVNIDSFSELKKLGTLAEGQGRKIRAGVRVYSSLHGAWSKFGIALRDLKKFWGEAEKYPFLELQGIHFHKSHNTDTKLHEEFFRELGDYLKENFNPSLLASIRFVDFGGGFFVNETEGLYSNEGEKHELTKAPSVETFAHSIAGSIALHLSPLVNCEYFTEPGRILSGKCMQILLQVMDKKNTNDFILNGGTNMIGWGWNEGFYFPFLNLNRPSSKEIPCTLHGCLCTPKDIWGKHCYAEKIEEGDFILMPNQGAYIYTLAQNFIKRVPPVYRID